MVAVADYPRILRTIIEVHAAYRLSVGEVEMEVMIDEAKGHYELVQVGWIGEKRVHGIVLHFDIRNDKIWIQYDGTQDGVANELVAAGVPKDRIVLAYKSPAMRPYTEFAVN
jgi:XisI protein